MSRFTRIAAIVSAVIVVLAGGLTLVVRSQIEPEKLKATIETEAAKVLGRKVTVGTVGASYGLAVSITDLKIMDAEGKAPQVTLGGARVAVAWAPLIKGQVKLASVALDQLDVKAVRNADGSLDSADVLAKVGGGAAGAGQAGTKGDVVNVAITNSRIQVTDLTGAGPKSLRWSEINGDIASGDDIALKLTGKLDAPAEKGELVLASKLTLAASYSLPTNKGQVTITGSDVALERVRAAVPQLAAAPVAPSGALDASVTISLEAGKPQFAGMTTSFHDVSTTGRVALAGVNGEIAYNGTSVDFSGFAFRNGPVAVVVPKASIEIKPGGVGAKELNFLVNDLPVNGSILLTGWPAAPQMTVRIAASKADLTKISKDWLGSLTADVTITGSPAAPSANGKLAFDGPARIVLPESAGGATVHVTAGTITLNGQDLSTNDVTCQVMGFTVKPRLQITSLFAGPQVAFDSGGIAVDLAKVPSMLTGDVAAKVKDAAPQGNVKLSLRAAGPLASPRLSGAVEPEGVSVQVPGTARRVTLARGKVDIAGSRATLSGIQLACEGIALLVSGGIEGLTGTPRLSLDVQGKNLQVAQLAALLPPEQAKQLEPYKAAGQVDVEALVAGTAATLRGDARIGLHGVSAVIAMGERKLPVTLNSGALEVSPTAVIARGVDGVVEGVAFQVGGQVSNYLTEPAFDVTALARGLNMERLKGFVPDDVIAQVQAKKVQLSFDAKASVKGTKAAPQVALRVLPTAGTLPLPIQGKTLVATLSPGGEIALEGAKVVLIGLPVTVAQNTVKISGTVKNPQGDAALDLKIEGQGLNIGGLAPMLPDAAKQALAKSGFRGGKGVRATVTGTVSAPQVEAVVDLTGAEFTALGPLGAGRIPHGAIKLKPEALVLDAVTLELGRAPFEVAGKVTLSDPPSISMSIKSEALDLAAMSAGLPLPAGVSLDGTTRVDLKIEGTAAAPRASGRVGLGGVGIRLPVLAAPLRGEGGELTLTGDDLVITDAAFRAGGSRITAKGRVVRVMTDPTLEGFEVTGPVELADAAAKLGMQIAGKGTIAARASGPVAALQIDGTVNVPSGTFTTKSGVPIPLANLAADFARSATQVKISKLSGNVAGGELAGNLSVNPVTSATVMNISLSGADLKKLTPQTNDTRMSGSTDITFQGTTAGGPETLNGNGQIKVSGLVVDLSKNAQLAQAQTGAAAGSVAVAALGGLLGKSGKSIGQKLGDEGKFYGEVFQEVRASHDLGTVTAPISAQQGVVSIDPIQGPKLTGRVRMNLGNGQIAGAIDRMQLGRAVIPVQFDGTMSVPKTHLDRNQITLDGKRFAEVQAANGTAEQPGTTGEQDLQSNLLKKVGGKNAKALQGLLGGGGDEAATAAPDAAAVDATAPAAPKKKKKLAGQLFDALTGGGEAPAEPADPAPADPAPAADPAAAPAESAPAEPAPAPKKKTKQKVLDALLKGL